MSLLKQQYQLLQSSRRVMLDFIEANIADITQPVAAFDNKSISFLLVHVANVYKHWVANYAMNKALPYEQNDQLQLAAIRNLFDEADALVADFIDHFEDRLDKTITGKILSGKTVQTTPLEVFTHVLTHEFHHKGQVMTMCRLLGSIPPDTDMIRT